MAEFGSSDSGASLGDILGAALSRAQKKDDDEGWRRRKVGPVGLFVSRPDRPKGAAFLCAFEGLGLRRLFLFNSRA